MIQLKSSTKVEVKTSPIHGMGVFAIEKIKKDEIIEECHLITVPTLPLELKKMSILFMHQYAFRYPADTSLKRLEDVLPLGNGCIYNHSNTNNAIWRDHPEYKAFQFVAIRDIEVGEEICTYYGGSEYWDFIENFKENNPYLEYSRYNKLNKKIVLI